MQVITAQEAAKLIPDGATVSIGGFVTAQIPEEVLAAVEQRYLTEQHPANLTLFFSGGIGNRRGGGADRFGHKGMLKRVIASHYNLTPALGELILHDEVEAYNFPFGVLAQCFRSLASKRPGIITRVGMDTFVDPKLEGGKISPSASEDLVRRITMEDGDYLHYRPAKHIDVAIIRGTTADTKGNISCEDEAVGGEEYSLAMAAKATGGIVIAQVKRIVEVGSVRAQLMKIPGLVIDYIVVCTDRERWHRQVDSCYMDHAYNGDFRLPAGTVKSAKLDYRKIIARRCAMELSPEQPSVNLGIGMPEGIPSVAAEEGISDYLILSVEAGAIGGMPASGLDFGVARNATGIYDLATHFNLYDGGGLDLAFLGLAETDQYGNINVSKFKGRIAGCGGFINITQNAKKVIFCGSFMAKGFELVSGDGQLRIIKEGTGQKFLQDVEQITFSAAYAREHSQPVLYVTERAVFKLGQAGMELIELAPGIDLERDLLSHMGFRPQISPDLKLMDERIFREAPMGIKGE